MKRAVGDRAEELAGWDPAPLATALDLIASGTRERCQIVFDFGSAGTVAVTLDLDFDYRRTVSSIGGTVTAGRSLTYHELTSGWAVITRSAALRVGGGERAGPARYEGREAE